MRAVVQRVRQARVEVEGKVVSSIGRGLLVFLGVGAEDTPDQAETLARKIHGLRIFEDESGRMNLDLDGVSGDVLVVSQFTLYADLSRGKRPGFERAMKPPEAERLYEAFCRGMERRLQRPVHRGCFGARMQVHLVNDGPATFVLGTT